EDADLRPVADADDVALDKNLVAGVELEDLALVGDREGDFVLSHRSVRTRPGPDPGRRSNGHARRRANRPASEAGAAFSRNGHVGGLTPNEAECDGGVTPHGRTPHRRPR